MSLASSTVIRDVTISLKDQLETIKDLRNRVKLESPGEISPSGIALSLYLYRMDEDYYLRNLGATYTQSPDSGKFTETPPPQAMILSYMMVPYGPPETTLIIANQIKELLYGQPVLQGDLLKGSLRKTGNEKISVIPIYPPMEKIHNIWMGFVQKPYRLTLFYNAVPVFLPAEVSTEVPLADHAGMDARQKDVAP